MAQTTTAKLGVFSGLIPTAKQACVWLIGTLVTVGLAGYAGSYFARDDNQKLAFKQQQLSDIQKFQASASSLDADFEAFNDALSDKRRVDSARRELREAISRHSSDANALQRIFDEKRAAAYMRDLAKFREEVDATTDSTNAMPMAQIGLDLINERRGMVSDVETKLGYKPKT